MKYTKVVTAKIDVIVEADGEQEANLIAHDKAAWWMAEIMRKYQSCEGVTVDVVREKAPVG